MRASVPVAVLVVAVAMRSLAGEDDCPLGAVIRREGIVEPPHVSADPFLDSQPIHLRPGGLATVHVIFLSRLPVAGPGIGAYQFGLAVEGNVTVVDATFDGTASDREPEGFRRSPALGGVEVIPPEFNSGTQGVIAILLFSAVTEVSLPPRGAADVLRITLRGPESEPAAGRIEFRNGLRGSGPPLEESLFVVAGESRLGGSPDDPLRCLLGTSIEPPFFRRGDADGNGTLELTDGLHIHRYLFAGKPRTLDCPDAADVDDDGRVNITDGIRVFLHLFRGGEAPPPPFEECGADATADGLTCAAFPVCGHVGDR